MQDELITPDEDDAFIDDGSRAGRYDVSYCGKHLGTRGDMDAAVGLLLETMNRDHFWPNVWHVNDHGNTTLLEIRETVTGGYSDFTYEFTGVAYV